MSDQVIEGGAAGQRLTPLGLAGAGRRLHRWRPGGAAAAAGADPGDRQIVTAAQLARLRPIFERYVGILIVLSGMVGSVMAFNGSWSTPFAWAMLIAGAASCTVRWYARWRRPVVLLAMLAPWLFLLAFNDLAGWVALWAFAAGTGGQALLTLIQWLYCHNRRSWQYRLSVAIDAGLSVKGYALVLLAPLVALLAFIPVAHGPAVAAWALIGGFSIGVAVLGEMLLVKSEENA